MGMAQSDRIAEHKNIAENRQARHNYHILEHWEAGIALTGGEVKSLRDGQAQLKDSYALVRDGQAVLLNCHISPYKNAGYATHEPDRTRRLLLHKAEIERIEGKTREVKCEVALAKGKQLYDKRETERQREADRSARQALKERTRR